MKRIGVDVGGTFTDLYYCDHATGDIAVEKVLSTPADPSEGVLQGLRSLCEKTGVALSSVDQFVHGTTVATNIALTHSGAEVGLITTEGFRDILHIARHKKPYNFSIQQEVPWQSYPLVKRRNRLTVRERITAPNGDVLSALNEDEVRARARELRAKGVESIAVCLLHSYLNPAHEQRVGQIVREEFPGCYVSLSSDVVPLYREFERFSTTALNAFIGPAVARYVTKLAESVKSLGYQRDILLMQSSGGMTPIATAASNPVNLLMSGPVAGLIGGIWTGKASEAQNVVTLDIGGTSADIGVAPDGALRMRHLLDTKVGDYQAMIPMVDIDTIGAGGGSIAFVDDGGIFRVGPQSSGADPGPACYGRGGQSPTSTDAQLLLGRLRSSRSLAGGEMQLDLDLARTAMKPLADQLELSVEEAALGALQIQKFGMCQSIELNSVRRGYDPREFTLVAGGGAGPLFACEIAAELEIPNVLVPAHPGIIAATGLLATDEKHEFVTTCRYSCASVDTATLQQRFDELIDRAQAQLDASGVPEDRRVLQRLADCRYEGQGYEVRFEVPPGPIDDAWVEELTERFHQAHETEYGHRFATGDVDIINIRVTAVGQIDDLPAPSVDTGAGDLDSALLNKQEVVFDNAGRPETQFTPFYDREKLDSGQVLAGPCVLEQYDSTAVVPPGFTATIDEHGNVLIACPAASSKTADQATPTDERADSTVATASSGASTELATPILMRVIGGAFLSIAKEMASVLFRMSYSSIIRESEDLGAGIFDNEGNMLAESDSTPMFMGSMPKIVRGAIGVLGDDINEGDVILHNDPYLGTTHSPDVAVIVPIFYHGQRIGFAGASGQLLDIGGAYPGLAVDLVDNQAEGQIFRAVKIVDRGVRNAALLQHIHANTRTPTHNEGDVEAMIAACRLAERRFTDVADRYGIEAVERAGDEWIRYSERMIRQQIAEVPDGVYETDIGYLDDDGKNRGTKLPISVKVIIEGDQITYDLTGSSPQVPTAYNCPFEGTTESAFAFITRMMFLDEAVHPVFVPQNEGMLKPIKVIAPEGSIFNPTYPASCFARFPQVQRAADLALRALAPVLPDRVTAGNSAHIHFMSYAGWNEDAGEYWVYLEVNEGSYGGRPESDGLDSVDNLIANTRNNPIEELEWRFPMRTDRYELRDEPCAAGRYRGGVGIVRVNTFLVDTVVTCEGDRHESDPPWGLFGGQDGLNASIVKNPGTASSEIWPSKITAYPLQAGDSLEITVPSAGGYGDPFDRDPKSVLSDVLDDLTTVELAERDYGVAIDHAELVLDVDRTHQLRAHTSKNNPI